MLVGWGESDYLSNDQAQFFHSGGIEGEDFGKKCWVIFIDASTDEHIRREQWDVLKDKRKS